MAVGERNSYQKRTTDGVIGTSGSPVVVYGISVQSGVDGGAVVAFYDGSSTGGTLVRSITGNQNDWFNEDYVVGRVYPNGLYIDLDANTTSVTVWFQNYP